MAFGWKKNNKIISSLIIASFLSSSILPTIVLAEGVERNNDSSTMNEEIDSENSSLESSSSSLVSGEEPVDSSLPEVEIVEENKDNDNAEIVKENTPNSETEPGEFVTEELDNEVTTDSEVKDIDKVDELEETEEQVEEFSEDLFSLEANRAEAMRILDELQNTDSPSMYAALPHTTEFIYNLAQSAVELGNKHNLYPSVMMAQAILETGWGKSTLSKAPNYNLFGIKGNYKGNSVKMKTHEYTQNGEKIYIYDYFKKYPSYKESFQDYAAFIRNTKGKVRYRNVWRENAPTYEHATAGLYSGGYATDPAYAQKLNNTIRYNKLNRYDENPTVSYTTHIQSKGWLPSVTNGKGSGTTKQNKRMEAVKITVPNFPNLGIQYSTHVQSKGWMNWVADGAVGGTNGENKRMEAIKIKLSGLQSNTYDVYYRVHAQSYGWLGWAKNGEEAGTAGFGKRLEALEVRILPKGASAPGTTVNPYVERIPHVSYSSHVQKIGWQKTVLNGVMSGTIGKSKRLEAIKIGVNSLSSQGGIQYRTHVESYGWQNWVSNEAISGSTGKSKRLEAIQMNLTGSFKDKYDVYYRVHAQSYGWLDWAKNGQPAGSEGKFKRLEAIEIKLVKKGRAAPGATARPFVN